MASNEEIGRYVTDLSCGNVGKCSVCGLVAPGVLQCDCEHANWTDLSAEERGQAVVAFIEGRTIKFGAS